MRNARPCAVCGLPESDHDPSAPGLFAYRPAPRTEPLRVLRNPVVIRPLWETAR
jgi:hypothetical protein